MRNAEYVSIFGHQLAHIKSPEHVLENLMKSFVFVILSISTLAYGKGLPLEPDLCPSETEILRNCKGQGHKFVIAVEIYCTYEITNMTLDYGDVHVVFFKKNLANCDPACGSSCEPVVLELTDTVGKRVEIVSTQDWSREAEIGTEFEFSADGALITKLFGSGKATITGAWKAGWGQTVTQTIEVTHEEEVTVAPCAYVVRYNAGAYRTGAKGKVTLKADVYYKAYCYLHEHLVPRVNSLASGDVSVETSYVFASHQSDNITAGTTGGDCPFDFSALGVDIPDDDEEVLELMGFGPGGDLIEAAVND